MVHQTKLGPVVGHIWRQWKFYQRQVEEEGMTVLERNQNRALFTEYTRLLRTIIGVSPTIDPDGVYQIIREIRETDRAAEEEG